MRSRKSGAVVELVNRYGFNSRNSNGHIIQLGKLPQEELNRIANALSRNEDIAELILSGSHIGDDGVAQIADALKKNDRLTTLHLANTNMTDTGLRTLIAMMQENQTITEIDISFNFVKQSLVSHLDELLKSNRVFQEAMQGGKRLLN